MEQVLFPFNEFWWFYLCFIAAVLFMLVLDLGLFHRKAREVTIKEAFSWSVFWVLLALVFNYFLYYFANIRFTENPGLLYPGYTPDSLAKRLALEFLTGYVVEKSLSVDNLFVFLVIFNYFGIPQVYQHRVLFLGILGALVFRVLFIVLASSLIKYHIVVYIFGAFLVLTGIKVFFAKDESIRPYDNPLVKLLTKYLPLHNDFVGQNFFAKVDGKLLATPLLLALLVIEISDITFAVDSVPAIIAISREPLIVFTSNIFAILGLRALYFLLSAVVPKLKYFKYGLGIILVFVGAKMILLNELFGGKFPTIWSLIIITGILTISALASFVVPNKE